ncbi:MAG: hypothetical protein Q9190_006000 [Brigantiaea leucoxantha]
MSQPPLFGIILPSRPVITNPLAISQTQFAFTVPRYPSFSHLIVFLVPGIELPPSTLAAVYIQFPSTPEFKLLGAISNDKQTAIFRIRNSDPDVGTTAGGGGAHEEEMTDVDFSPAGPTPTNGLDPNQQVTIGISIEPATNMEAQLAALRANKPSLTSSAEPASSALVLANRNQRGGSPLSTKVLAQRIIKNAFNFLASFAGETRVGGEEMVPLKSFRGWWEKFERKVENDPGFLERQEDV